MSYLVVSDDCSEIYNSDGKFFYDLDIYDSDRLVIDLNFRFYMGVLFSDFTRFLKTRGFKFIHHSICNNISYGIPVYRSRFIICCSKQDNSGFNIRLDNFRTNNMCCPPLCLLYGRFNIFRLYSNWCDKLGFPSDFAKNSYDEFLGRFDGVLPCEDFVDSVVNLYSNPKPKFSDGSNDLPRGKFSGDVDLSVDDRISMLGVIGDDNYYHFNPRRVFCNVREILRLNGFSDDFVFTGSRDECVELVSSRLSPFVVDIMFECLF